jgi:aspartate ammonia-lyase
MHAEAAVTPVDQFFDELVVYPGSGSGTSLALALESLGHKKGEYQYVNPNDHVNFGQSTKDVYPTAFHPGLILRPES